MPRIFLNRIAVKQKSDIFIAFFKCRGFNYTAVWRQQPAASSATGTVTGSGQVPVVTNLRHLLTHVALVLFITNVISDNECRKEREIVF